MPNTRITVTLPPEIIQEIDHEERNRSRFVLEAVKRELERRRREQLRQSLRNPHPESLAMAEVGFAEWAGGLPEEDSDLVAPGAGEELRWTADRGWVGGGG